MSDHWPDKLRIRDTGLCDDLGGAGQRIFTTAGQGYEKREYIRADLVAELEAQILEEQKETLAAKALERDLTLCERDNAHLRVDLANAEALLEEIAAVQRYVIDHGLPHSQITTSSSGGFVLWPDVDAILAKRKEEGK